ncbi:hypothetical protein JY572_27980 [Myxococcus landrumensis]|uniref:DUF3142 domain-containing protein n=1 Tax=Myxococcus landrumensis TaxID=2813577 RepID=A0ABX7NHU0_9BACT|nr:hypothetical protein JY572_27980 [Myxococcus landrumus]
MVLWAWERPEDLRFLEGQPVDVAFLLATVELTDTATIVRSRRQPLRMPAGMVPRATVRLEMREGASLARFKPERISQLADQLITLAVRPDATGLQLDFDARESEYDAYLSLLQTLRERLPSTHRLSITGLASWCVPGSWVTRAPVDEVVPQLFRMGPESAVWRRRFAREIPLPCQGSVGLAFDEPRAVPPGTRTLYVFNPKPWTSADYARIVAELSP